MPERVNSVPEAMNSDFAQRFLFEDLPIRGGIVRLNDSWKEVLSRSRPHDSVRPMLGEVLCAAALLAANAKFEGSIGLQVQGAGPVRLLHGQCSHDGRLRGIAHRGCGVHSDEASKALLAINLALSSGGSTYQGIVSLEQAGIAASLESYFRQSDQLETRFWLIAGEGQCQGLMLQRVPGKGANEEAWERVVKSASAICVTDLARLDSKHLLLRLFDDESLRLFTASMLSFGCSCSVRRVSEVLQALGRNEVFDVVAEQGAIEVTCEYCGTAYTFDRVDAAALFAGGDSACAGTSTAH